MTTDNPPSLPNSEREGGGGVGKPGSGRPNRKNSNIDKLPNVCKIKCEEGKFNIIKKYSEGELKY